jgi:ABC-type lipoprotein export system ATPase subunit
VKEKEISTLKEISKNIIEQLEINKQMEKIIKESEAEVMDKNINSINIQLNNILSTAFDDIKIEIGLLKDLKNGETKPQINLKVQIDGKEFPNLDYPSGGQQDWISVALTITFNLILGSKIIILDEVMASLSGRNREKCLKIIKTFLKDKIIISVCHDVTEGYYDEIIAI